MSVASAPQRDQARRFAPLVAMVGAVLLTILGLPSALNLPQTNPTQTLEYAPVPPQDQNAQAPPGGNIAGLGLGTSDTAPGGGVPSPTPTPGPGATPPVALAQPTQLAGTGGNPSSFRCVAGRQTEDPLAPPCAATYGGSNGGSTYQGVSATEITVLYYLGCTDMDQYATSQGTEVPPCGTEVDLTAAPASSDFIITRILKRYLVYFNSRYQQYNRKVHMYAIYSAGTTANNECDQPCRVADASNNAAKYRPFAILASQGSSRANVTDPYQTAMAQRGVLAFGGAQQRASFYAQYPGLVWAYQPTLEDQAAMYGTYLCQKIVNQPTSFGGLGVPVGQTRKLGLFWSHESKVPVDFYSQMRDLLIAQLQKCGASFAVDHRYFPSGPAGGTSDEPTTTQSMSDFKTQGVTTIVWDGQPDGNASRDATQLGYGPEWVVVGEGNMEDWTVGRYSQQQSWADAIVMSNVPFQGRQSGLQCAQAIHEVDPSYPAADDGLACNYYDDLRQLFTGIQVSGPHLTPQSMDQGFHAIPGHPSSDPRVPACFYPAGSYTCVKDAEAMWWNGNGAVPGWTGQGCYASMEGGKRYLAGQWPSGNADAQRKMGSDPCNGYGGTYTTGAWTQT